MFLRIAFVAILVVFHVDISYSQTTECYAFDREMPDRQPILNSAVSEIWCYQKDGDVTLIFDPDNTSEKRTTVLVQSDSLDKVLSYKTIINKGGAADVVESFDLSLRPLNVPLTATEARQVGHRVSITMGPGDHQDLSSIYRDYSSPARRVVNKNLYELKEGIQVHYLAQDKQPWIGHLFDYGPQNMWTGSPQPPLEVYDRLMEEWTGTSPNSRDWEKNYHSLDYVPWGGHCNGWAAASVLYNEPTSAKWSTELNEKIEVSTLKGLLVESSFCVKWAFYGTRYRGQGDLYDIDPAKFHKVLLYYIYAQDRPVAMDYFRNDSVDNAVITGYRFQIEKTTEPNQFKVLANIKVHQYQNYRTEDTGIAGHSDWVYEYILNTTPSGLIKDGEWKGYRENPDFLWVPLAQSQCGRENPRISHLWVEKMLRDLPDYTGQDQPRDPVDPADPATPVDPMDGSNTSQSSSTSTGATTN